MRTFWTIVALLAAIGLWFVLSPQKQGKPSTTTRAEAREVAAPSVPSGIQKSATAIGSDSASTSDLSRSEVPPKSDGSVASASLPDFGLLGESGLANNSTDTPKRTLRVDTRTPSEIVRRIDERTLELDGRYRVTGNGSASDPYVISWELLTSASEFIDLSQNARTAPPWVRLLDGTYVQISGYYSTAVRVSVAKNLLLTLNRWDGCCIGVPPTPFDAIDITMRDPLAMGGLHLIRFGTFRGQLRVEPVEAATYLLSFYRLEDATFETK